MLSIMLCFILIGDCCLVQIGACSLVPLSYLLTPQLLSSGTRSRNTDIDGWAGRRGRRIFLDTCIAFCMVGYAGIVFLELIFGGIFYLSKY